MFQWKKMLVTCFVFLIGFCGFKFGHDYRSANPSFLTASSLLPSGKKTEVTSEAENYSLIQQLMTVLSFVENNYVDPVSRKTLVFGAMRGMLETLDPHSHFLSAEEFKDMQVDTSGQFGGIGIEIGMKDNILTIMSAIEDTPAAKVGLQKGDRITKINHESTFKMTLTQAVNKMRGKEKTDVILTIYRDSFKTLTREKEFVITRDIIKIRPVKQEVLEEGYAYVRLSTFNEQSSSDLKKAIDSMLKKAPIKGLVFDLRNNPGGLLDQAVEVSSLFLKSGVVVSTIGRDPQQKEVRNVTKPTSFPAFEIVVLVNASTASAAEIVAGALRDHKRALILGQPTFGKGSVQTVTPLSADTAVKMTTARYYTPSGISIQEKGVKPDILLDRYDPRLLTGAKIQVDSFREKDLKGHMANLDQSEENDSLQDNEDKEAKKEQEKQAKAKLLKLDKKKTDEADDDWTPYVFNPKEDFEVKQALTILKSRILLKNIPLQEEGK